MLKLRSLFAKSWESLRIHSHTHQYRYRVIARRLGATVFLNLNSEPSALALPSTLVSSRKLTHFVLFHEKPRVRSKFLPFYLQQTHSEH